MLYKIRINCTSLDELQYIKQYGFEIIYNYDFANAIPKLYKSSYRPVTLYMNYIIYTYLTS